MALLEVAASRLWRKSKLWNGSSRAMAQSVGIDRHREPGRGRMRLSVFQCAGPSPVVTERSGESRAQAGALVVIHPFCDEFFVEAKKCGDDAMIPLSGTKAPRLASLDVILSRR